MLDNHIKVERAMTTDPITVTPDDLIIDAVDLFIEHRFGALPVVDGAGKLVGILSSLDMLRVLRERLR